MFHKLKLFIKKKLGVPKDDTQSLINRGIKVGKNVDILSSRIDDYVEIGNNVTITNATILTHDASIKKFLGKSKIGKVVIGNDVFVGLGAIILPGTIIGNKVIIGAGAVVSGKIEDNSVIVGNPCKKLCSFDDYILKHKNKMNDKNIQNKEEKKWYFFIARPRFAMVISIFITLLPITSLCP